MAAGSPPGLPSKSLAFVVDCQVVIVPGGRPE